MVTVCPPTLIVPVRGAANGFGATEKKTVVVPKPVPEGELIVIHVALLATGQLHEEVGATTWKLPDPPFCGAFRLSEGMVTVQAAVTLSPEILRVLLFSLASTI